MKSEREDFEMKRPKITKSTVRRQIVRFHCSRHVVTDELECLHNKLAELVSEAVHRPVSSYSVFDYFAWPNICPHSPVIKTSMIHGVIDNRLR